MKKTGESYVTALGEVRRRAPRLRFPFSRTPEERELARQLADLCAQLGCSTTSDPAVPGEWATPALRIQPGAGTPCYLDVAVAGDRTHARAVSPDLRAIHRFAKEIEELMVDVTTLALPAERPKLGLIGRAPRPTSPLAAAVARAADRLVDPDLPYVVAVAAGSDVEAGVIEVWTGVGGPRLHVSGVLAVDLSRVGAPAVRLYHHPEPRRPLTATPLLRLPQAIWLRGRYVHGAPT
jgi:hypothetical protein